MEKSKVETFYRPGEQRAGLVHDLFAAIAGRYDLINDLQSFGLHRAWKNKVIELARPSATDRVLDVCCGTGDIALRFAPLVREVIGYDFSEPMLEIARRRSEQLLNQAGPRPEPGPSPQPSPIRWEREPEEPASRTARDSASASSFSDSLSHRMGEGWGEGLVYGKGSVHGKGMALMGEGKSPPRPNITFLQGDALHLPFPDASFEIVTIGYGLRNLADFHAGLREIWRVLKPNGRLLILDFGKPDNRAWRWLYFQYLRWLVPVFGKLLCGNSATHAYILQSLLNYPAQKGVAAEWEKMGCSHSEVINFLGGVMSINYALKKT